jgi:hypothetical protein
MLLARFDASTGLLDPDFGDNGVTIVDFGTGDSPSFADGEGVRRKPSGACRDPVVLATLLNRHKGRHSGSSSFFMKNPGFPQDKPAAVHEDVTRRRSHK